MKTPTPLKRAILVMALISINLFGTTDKLFAQTANALNFDGNDDYVDITPSVPYTGTFTIEGWIKTSDPNAKLFIWESTVLNGHAYLGLNLGTLRLSVGGSGGVDQLDGNTIISNNTWHHIAVVKSGTSVTFYVDGIPDGSGTSTRNPSSTISGSAIGAGIINGSLQGYSIETIDEVRIWNIARTQSEIMNNKDCELNAQTGLAALYHFNHGIPNGSNPSTTVLTDYSGNSRNGVLGGFALNGTTSNWVNSIVFQPTNIYRTITSGNWSDPAIWETQYGSCWVPAVTAPTSTDSSISIRNGHTVTVNSVVTIDQTQVDAGGSLIVSSGTLQV
ncbi:MAG: LamG domain-containing protein, partial [Bacteroidia bacterium]|nr:LamG domain-containing protein [Bacteroidia bacterium]